LDSRGLINRVGSAGSRLYNRVLIASIVANVFVNAHKVNKLVLLTKTAIPLLKTNALAVVLASPFVLPIQSPKIILSRN
jgi:hypothetical protein